MVEPRDVKRIDTLRTVNSCEDLLLYIGDAETPVSVVDIHGNHHLAQLEDVTPCGLDLTMVGERKDER